ncbi:MAG TPA: septal ring lytic transglycosylase RlpA family protein [Candidatus Binatia bacterium]|jgi:rare lipoprotein A
MKQLFVHDFRNAAAGLALAGLSACAVPAGKVKLPPFSAPEGRAAQTGIASWYGPGFHGQATASGVIYNQYDLTAAHQTLPLGSRVVVTNLNNGKSVEVLINDRGPFAKGRIIDLSHAAAQSIELVGPGTAPVRIEVIEAPYKIPAIRASLDYTLQLGSFAQLENAQQMRDRLQQSFAEIAVVPTQSSNGTYYRVQLGTYSNRAAAEEKARQLAQNGFSVIIMEKQ